MDSLDPEIEDFREVGAVLLYCAPYAVDADVAAIGLQTQSSHDRNEERRPGALMDLGNDDFMSSVDKKLGAGETLHQGVESRTAAKAAVICISF